MPVRKKAAAPEPQSVQLNQLNIQRFLLRLVGDTSLLSHAWSNKSKKAMLDKQMMKAQVREAKDPEEQFRNSLYPMPDGNGYGFPVTAFKSSAVDACSYLPNLTKVLARGAFYIVADGGGDLVRIDGSEPTMREDTVRNQTGVADLRYRASFFPWSVDLPIRYNASVISLEQLINLFEVAGFSVGVGDWRPQRDGDHGRYHCAKDGE